LIRSGTLDRRITLQRATVTQNTIGEGAQAWAALATVWASVAYIKDAEREKSGQIRAERQARFMIRWSPTVASINAKDRLVFDGSTYEIWGTKEIGRREGIEISATMRADL
jgi:SPP1 family predicted phage head-tail adaptor